MRTILIPKRSGGLARLLCLFAQRREIFLVDVKKSIAKSTLYGHLLKDLIALNEAVHSIDPGLWLLKPDFRTHPVTGSVQHTLRLHDRINLTLSEHFVHIHLGGTPHSAAPTDLQPDDDTPSARPGDRGRG